MKKGIISLVVLLILFPSVGFCDYACDLCLGLLGESAGESTIFSLKALRISDSSHCSDSIIAARNTELLRPIYSGGNCSAGTLCCQTSDCGLITAIVLCDSAWSLLQAHREHSLTGEAIVQSVPVGSEAEAAEAAFQTFDSTNLYHDYSSLNLTRTDGLKGYSYIVSEGVDGNSVVVTVDMWKRGGYAPAGMVTTLENLGNASSGTSVTKTDVQDAFTAALGLKHLSDGEIGTQLDLAFAKAHALGYIGADGGISVGGIDQASTTQAVKDALDVKFPVGSFTGVPVLTGVYSVAVPADSYAKSFADFKTVVKGSEFYSLGNAFFGGVPISAGAPPVIVVDGGHTFGSHTFDFSVLSPFLAIIKSCVVLAFCFISVKLLVVNK